MTTQNVTSSDDRPNAEVVNGRAKLIFHRLFNRRIRHNSRLIAELRRIVKGWKRDHPERPYVALWPGTLGPASFWTICLSMLES